MISHPSRKIFWSNKHLWVNRNLVNNILNRQTSYMLHNVFVIHNCLTLTGSFNILSVNLLKWSDPKVITQRARPRSAVGNVSGYRCVSDCRSRGHKFDPSPVPYFRGDWSWNDFYSHSPPFRWFIQEGLLSVTSESMCTNYWLTACSSLPRKKCG